MMTNRTIYLDNNATTPCAPEVVTAMLPYFSQAFANPASPHLMGSEAAHAVQEARGRIAAAIGADTGEIILTGGATESNNMVLLGLTDAKTNRSNIVTSSIEHKSVLEPLKIIASRGFEVRFIPVTRAGIADVDVARELIDSETLLVSIQGANNEIGALQPVSAVAEIAREHGAVVHCDASQTLGKVPCSVDDLGVDFASFSAHKCYGPKGAGCLFARTDRRRLLAPISFGGGQESGLRPGTVNVPAVVGFGVACDLVAELLTVDAERISHLRDTAEAELAALSGVTINASTVARLPGTSSVTINDVPADALIANIAGVCFGSGSACTSGSVSPSHVLMALGLERDSARNSVRLSIGRYNDAKEIREAVSQMVKAVERIRCSIGALKGKQR